MNVPDMVAKGLIQCVWILRTCLQMHSCIPLKQHQPEHSCNFNDIVFLYAHGALINQFNLLLWVWFKKYATMQLQTCS